MRGIGGIVGLIMAVSASTAVAAPAEYFDLGKGAVLETGDAWSMNGERYRLYGVQSCFRGTLFTNKSGKRQDCGDASLSMLAAFIKDTHPSCAPIAEKFNVTYVVCFAIIAGQPLDLGMMLVSEGYAFAALDLKGLPVNPAYAVAEQQARRRKSGFWQFPDVQHPSVLLGRAVNGIQEERQ